MYGNEEMQICIEFRWKIGSDHYKVYRYKNFPCLRPRFYNFLFLYFNIFFYFFFFLMFRIDLFIVFIAFCVHHEKNALI